MSSFLRKLFCLFFLNILVLCSLTAQIIPVGGIVGGIMYISKHKQKPVEVFGNYKFDTADAIIGMSFSDSTNNSYDRFSFFINNVNDLNDLKESWKFKEVNPVNDQHAFNIYFTKDKVVKSGWIIFLDSKAIVTDKGYFNFDTALLSKLHTKNPLVYNVHSDAISSKNDFLRFKDSVTVNPSFLFLEEPDMSYEGSFDITVKAGSKMSAEDIGERIVKRCNKIKPKSDYKVYLKKDGKTYLVRCNQFLAEQFSDPDMEKSSWIPALYTIKSYWRIN